MGPVKCPLCGQRKARRQCPALGHLICSVCCGSKRQTEIQCPSDCGYLAAAREHVAAPAMRQRRDDITRLVHATRDLNDRQSRVFLSIMRFLGGYRAPEIQPLLDTDLAQATGALAATLETADRGVIYEHRPESLPAARLLTALKPVLDEADKPHAPGFERDAAVVLRRFEELARANRERKGDTSGRRSALELLDRMAARVGETAPPEEGAHDTRLIVP